MGERQARRPRAGPLPLSAVVAAGPVALAYAAGWAVAATRNPFGPQGLLPAVLYGVGEILAVLAAPGWLAVVLVLARTPRQATAWLIAGLVLLAPVPLVVGRP